MSAILWHAPLADQYLWEESDDELFLLNPASGYTHVLTPMGAEILKSVGEMAQTNIQLAERFKDHPKDVDQETFTTFIYQHLSQLASMGLVEKIGLVTDKDEIA